MARYYSLSPSTFADDFRAALEDYYGDGVTIESASGNTIVFQCPAICDKVLKFATYNSGFRAYFGDSSANMKMFASSYAANGETTFHLVLSEAFLLLESALVTDSATSAIVGKLTNGRYLAVGAVTSKNNTYYNVNTSWFTDDSATKTIWFTCPAARTLVSGRKMCLWPAHVACEDEIEQNEDGTFATIPGLWLTFTTSTQAQAGSNFYLSKGPLYAAHSGSSTCATQKYVELEVVE